MELDEFQVGDLGTGPERESDAVAGGDVRVRGGRVDLADAAGRENHGGRMNRTDTVVLAFADHVQSQAGGAAVIGEQQVDGHRVLDHVEPSAIWSGAGLRQGEEKRAGDLGPGGVAARVRDPAAQVTAFPGQGERAIGLAVELSAERDQPPDGVGPVGHQGANRFDVAEPGAGDESVGQVLLG